MNPATDILVAIDGSPESTAALAWASREAQASARGLRLVHVVEYLPGYGYLWAATVGAHTALQDSSEPILAGARAFVRDAAPAVPVHAGTVTGSVAQALLAECEQASLAVVGSRGAGSFSRLLLGSVTYRLATHASCPIVIVDSSAGLGAARPGGPTVRRVVVGVGAADDTTALIEFAFTEAQHHGVSLVAIRVWEPPDPTAPFALPDGPRGEYSTRRDRYERTQLLQAIAPARAAHPRVRATVRVRVGGASARLTRACQPGDLLVIGHRHSGHFSPPALGAVSSVVTHHARCPVAIVPTGALARVSPRTPTAADLR